MKIYVKAKAGAKENKIVPPTPKLFLSGDRKDEYFVAFVKEPPIQGKANQAITRLLATHFKVPVSKIELISGAKSKMKIFEIFTL